jgi:hypothetical protein
VTAHGWQLAGHGPDAYEEYLVPAIFAPWAEALVDLAGPWPGDRVLDVACGTGVSPVPQPLAWHRTAR